MLQQSAISYGKLYDKYFPLDIMSLNANYESYGYCLAYYAGADLSQSGRSEIDLEDMVFRFINNKITVQSRQDDLKKKEELKKIMSREEFAELEQINEDCIFQTRLYIPLFLIIGYRDGLEENGNENPALTRNLEQQVKDFYQRMKSNPRITQ
ncbi:hypothetical protein H8702_09875 [Massilimaliae timonensis]|uniref:Uncharacterized protein n=1 Tax=Massiliimalia timonensis TaxID=1987501 RepID=A0A8J6PBZ7_9FIRM|nr:hypothetical protein [Massiliimalia timonensis]MBC8611407.1 hypothetical protein [Massiliimalia timonensis]